MSRVFPDLDDARPDQSELAFPASRRDRPPAGAPAEGEPARAEFFRAQRRPVLPLLGLFGAAATVAAFLWLGRDEVVPSPEVPGDGLAPVAAAPGFEAPLPGVEGLEAVTSTGSLAAPAVPEPEPGAAAAPMPAVPSVLDDAPALEGPPAPGASAPAAKSFSVQLLAGRSEASVGSSWERLRGEYPELLSSLTPSVTRTSRPEGDTFYRLRAGPLRDRASADALCKALSARQQSCFVVSPGS
jgi:cell division septation protein DedD